MVISNLRRGEKPDHANMFGTCCKSIAIYEITLKKKNHNFIFITGLHSYIKYKNLNENYLFTNVQNVRLYYTNLTINKKLCSGLFFCFLYKNMTVLHIKIIAPCNHSAV